MPTEQPDAPRKSLIFISHSSKDKLVANAICARLENQGIRCWIAPRDVNPGRDYSDQIAEALENSTVMVMVVSSGSNSSRHVKSEIDRAFSLGHIIVPFRVENIELDKGLAYYLSKTHWLDAVTPPLEQHIDHLAATIRKLSNQDSPPTSQAQPVLVQPLPPQPVPAPAGNKWLWPLVAAIAGLLTVIAILGFVFLKSRQENATAKSPEAPTATTPIQHVASPPPISPSSAIASVPNKTSIEGTWTITGARTLGGTSYGGTVEFVREGDRYQVMWQTSAGTYSGVALARGNKLCAGWSAEAFGVVFYKIGGDGTLNATWTIIGAAVDQSDGIEQATGGTPGKLEGHYVVTGSNPGSQSRYTGTLGITRTGGTYRLQWKVENSVTIGVGIKIDDDLFVVWGDKDHPFGVVSYTFEGERARGVWTLGGSSATGTENLVKQ